MQAQLSTITLIGTVIVHVFGYYGETNKNNVNAGTGTYGTCCTEIDIWEANNISAAFTLHSCDVKEETRCEGADKEYTETYGVEVRAISCPWAS